MNCGDVEIERVDDERHKCRDSAVVSLVTLLVIVVSLVDNIDDLNPHPVSELGLSHVLQWRG